jgi:hypothetical protein
MMFPWTFSRREAVLLSPIALILLIFFLQKNIDLTRKNAIQAGLETLPSGAVLRVMALEFKEVTADFLWLRAVGLLDKKELPDPFRYQRFYDITDRVTDLDPLFSSAYEAGGVILSVLAKNPFLSNALLEKGMQNQVSIWQLPFYMGFNYAFLLNDSVRAAHYMELASKIEGHPPYLPLLTARLYNQGGNRETAILFLKGVLLTVKDKQTKKAIANQIIAIEKELETPSP